MISAKVLSVFFSRIVVPNGTFIIIFCPFLPLLLFLPPSPPCPALKCFLNLNVLVECEKDLIDFYWYWLKDNASYDFVDAMIYINEESGFKIACDGGNFNVRKIDYENEWDIIRKIEAVFKKR